eukprot:TRINITY_DN11130_c0_g1_i1.p1 TRINITY_DN11130_c0_g1~~TRINITY_DN11130_c0_g1_i1.p1  ORF type:complete len:1231 (-),score=352.28 TRINITY_DN11130_c0_g1_i1:91-3678(-)
MDEDGDFLSIGCRALVNRRWDEAISSFTYAIDIAEVSSPDVLLWRASAFREIGKNGEAIKDLQSALELRPSGVELRVELCSLLCRTGRLKEAKDVLISHDQEGLAHDARRNLSLAHVCMQLGELREAADALERVARLDGLMAKDIVFRSAEMGGDMEDLDEERVSVRHKGVDVLDGKAAAIESIWQAEWDLAIRRFNDILSLHPEDEECLLGRGMAYAATANYIESIKDLRKLLHILVCKHPEDGFDPSIPLVAFNTACVEVLLRRYNEALIVANSYFPNLSEDRDQGEDDEREEDGYGDSDNGFAKDYHALRIKMCGVVGICHAAQRSYQEAVKYLRRFMKETNSTSLFPTYCLALCEIQVENYPDAERILSTLIERFPHHPRLLFLRGLAFERQSRYQKAIVDWERAAKHPSSSWIVWSSLARSYMKTGCSDEALGAFTTAIELLGERKSRHSPFHSMFIILLAGRGKLLLEKSRFQTAIGDFTQIIRSRPDIHVGYHLRGRAYAKMGDYDRAIADLAMALERDIVEGDFDGLAHIHLDYALIYEKDRQWKRAIEQATHAIVKDGTVIQAYLIRGRCHAKCGDLGLAIADFSRHIANDPPENELRESLIHRSLAFRLKRNLAEALKDCIRYQEVDQRDPYGHYLASRLLEEQHEFEDAYREINWAIRLSMRNPVLIAQRGKLHAELFRASDAMDDFTSALHIRPTYYPCYRFRSDLFTRTGEYDSALRDLSRVGDNLLLAEESDLSFHFDEERDLQHIILETEFLRSVLLFYTGQQEKAVEAAKIAVKEAMSRIQKMPERMPVLDIWEKWAFGFKGVVERSLKKYKESLASLGIGLRFDPTREVGWIQLERARTFAASEEYARAIGDYDAVFSLLVSSGKHFPISPSTLLQEKSIRDIGMQTVHVERGKCLYFAGDLEGAESDFNAALKLDAFFVEAFRFRGLTRIKMGRRKSGMEDLESAVRLNPVDIPSHFALAHAHFGQHALKETVEHCDAILLSNRDHADAQFLRGQALQLQKDFDGAVQSYSCHLALKPDSLRTLCHRAYCQGKLGRVERALKDVSKVVEIDPKYAHAYLVRGNIHRDLGYLDLAGEDFSQAILHDPEFAKAHLSRSLIRYMQKDYLGALSDVNHALEIDDHLVEAYSTRCSIKAALNQWESALMDVEILLDRVWEPALREKLLVKKHLIERKASSLD